MNRVLRIADITDGVFPFMPPVLAPLAPEAHALHWSILDLGDVTSDQRWDLNLPFVEQQALGSATGFKLSFEDLTAFAARVHQVIDGLFVGCERPSQLPRRSDNDLTILRKADMLVAAFDSTFWLVSASDDVLDRYPTRFRQVTEEDPASIRLSAWDRD
jgi:hypothetical protein